MVDSAVGQGRVGVGHLERRDPDAKTADPLSRITVKRTGDAHGPGRFGHVPRSDIKIELGIDGVDRVGCGLGDRHHSLPRFGVVDRPGGVGVGLEGDWARAVVAGGVRVDALHQRGRQDERLEGRTGLAVAVGGQVVLVGVVVG